MAKTKKELIADIKKHITNIWNNEDYAKVMLESVKTSQTMEDLRMLEFDLSFLDNLMTNIAPKINQMMDEGVMDDFFTDEERAKFIEGIDLGKDIAVSHLLALDIENNVLEACAWQHIAYLISLMIGYINLNEFGGPMDFDSWEDDDDDDSMDLDSWEDDEDDDKTTN